MMIKSNKPFGEIIESSLVRWKGLTWQWDFFPSFGTPVVLESVVTENTQSKLLGIVHDVQTGSQDPVRQPFAYQKTEEELHAEQPQIFAFLQTTFLCAPLGFQNASKIYYQLPEQPPKIHAFVRYAYPDELQLFFTKPYYLPVLFGLSSTILYIDELLLALLKTLAQTQVLTSTYLQEFMSTFNLLTGNDYRRLKLFLQRAEHLLHQAR